MIVIAKPLARGVSITLVCADDGWRFGSWSSNASMTAKPLPLPSDEALFRRFATDEEAMERFRGLRPF